MGGEVTRVWLLATNLTEVWQAVIVFIPPPPRGAEYKMFYLKGSLMVYTVAQRS